MLAGALGIGNATLKQLSDYIHTYIHTYINSIYKAPYIHSVMWPSKCCKVFKGVVYFRLLVFFLQTHVQQWYCVTLYNIITWGTNVLWYNWYETAMDVTRHKHNSWWIQLNIKMLKNIYWIFCNIIQHNMWEANVLKMWWCIIGYIQQWMWLE